MLDGKFRDTFKVLTRGTSTSRVRWEIDENDPSLWRDGCGNLVGFERKLIFLGRHHRHRDAVRHDDARAIGNVARLVINHLVAGIEQRAESNVDGLRNA